MRVERERGLEGMPCLRDVTLGREDCAEQIHRTGEAGVEAQCATGGRFRTGDSQEIQSLLFWVGGVPQDKWDAAGGDSAKLPSLHSPFWAPDPEPTILTATEAMTTAALELLKKR